jgi:hypothetical protein
MITHVVAGVRHLVLSARSSVHAFLRQLTHTVAHAISGVVQQRLGFTHEVVHGASDVSA